MGTSESTCGFRLIYIAESSPAEKAGLVSYLDFIVSANGIPLSPDQTLSTIVNKSVNCKVLLKVYNVLSEDFRTVEVTPSNSWGGEVESSNKNLQSPGNKAETHPRGLLGASVRWENWSNCEGIRVLEVAPGSNAQKYGLQVERDYILGTEQTSINDYGSLEQVLTSKSKFDLYVYSTATGKVRRIQFENCKTLGCTVGEGLANSIKNASVPSEEKKQEPEPEKIVVTVLQKAPEAKNEKPQENIPPPPPPPAVVKDKSKIPVALHVLPPPSIYDLSMEGLTFQPKVLLSKYIQSY